MGWQLSALLLLGGSTVLLFLGLPVALSFVTINIVGACSISAASPVSRRSRATASSR